MSAKEMFAKLGFELITDSENILEYKYENIYIECNEDAIEWGTTKLITFDKKYKIFNILVESSEDNEDGITIEELKAINKQVEELNVVLNKMKEIKEGK